MMGVDPRRFGPYATRGYLRAKNEEAYANVFTVHYPDEERAAARPLKRAPCYDRMKALGAVFGSVYGWERPNWFAPEGYGSRRGDLDKPDVLLNENHPPVGAGREAAGEVELPPLELFRLRRRRVPQRARERRPLRTCRPSPNTRSRARAPRRGSTGSSPTGCPKGVGRIAPRPHAVEERRRPLGVHDLSRGAGEASTSSAPAPSSATTRTTSRSSLPRDGSRRPPEGDDAVRRARARRPALARAPADADRHRPVEQELSLAHRASRSTSASAQARALRVNFVGELGWELHHPIEMQNTIFDLLMEAGRPLGIRPFGIRAMDSHAAREVLPPDPARAVDRVRRARIRPRPLRASQQGRVPRPRRAGALAAAGLPEPLRDDARSTARPTRTRAAPSRSMSAANSSAAAPPAATAGGSASRWRSAWSLRSSPRSGRSSTSRSWASGIARWSSRSRRSILTTSACGPDGPADDHPRVASWKVRVLKATKRGLLCCYNEASAGFPASFFRSNVRLRHGRRS